VCAKTTTSLVTAYADVRNNALAINSTIGESLVANWKKTLMLICPMQEELTAYRKRATFWFVALNLLWLTLVVVLDAMDVLQVRIFTDYHTGTATATHWTSFSRTAVRCHTPYSPQPCTGMPYTMLLDTHHTTCYPQIGGVGLSGVFSAFAFALGTALSFLAMLKHRFEAAVFAVAVALLQPKAFRSC
jgi:hypothetical protein